MGLITLFRNILILYIVYCSILVYFLCPAKKVDFYFYEYLSNVYKRGFIEMHFKICDLIHKDNFFGAPMKQGKFLKPCPYPPGDYHFYNMSIDQRVIPLGFPFQKGRIYGNLSIATTNESVATGYIDMEVKEINMKEEPSMHKS